MKKTLNIFTIAIAISIMAFLPAKAENVLAFNIDRALAESKAGKNIAEQLQKYGETIQGKAQKLQQDLQSDAEKLQEQRSLMSQEALQGKFQELQQKEAEGRQTLSVEARSVENARNQALQVVIDKVSDILEAISRERKADLIIRSNVLLFANPDLDITDEVIKRLDKEITKVKVDVKKEQ